jgi:hypothetical protein
MAESNNKAIYYKDNNSLSITHFHQPRTAGVSFIDRFEKAGRIGSRGLRIRVLKTLIAGPSEARVR